MELHKRLVLNQREWFKREFNRDIDPRMLPGIVERLIGTPVRLEAKLEKIPPPLFTRKPDGQWSIQENAGHLLDLEPVWMGRTEDILSGKEELSEVDLTNKKTDSAGHNLVDIREILEKFKEARERYVERLTMVTEEDLNKSSLHPRMGIPMKITDLAFFVAEHDDHHLAQMTALASIP